LVLEPEGHEEVFWVAEASGGDGTRQANSVWDSLSHGLGYEIST